MSAPSAGPIRFGVIGCGSIAYWVHLRILQQAKGAMLVVASDPSPEARQKAAHVAKVPIVESAEEMLKDHSIDAVVICSPTHLHADHATLALAAGKHVFLEKPIASNAEDSERIVLAAKESGLSTMVGFNRRRHPLFEQAQRLIASGILGRVHAVQSAFCEPNQSSGKKKWRDDRETGGGVLLDLASHHADLLRWFLDDEVETVNCSISSAVTEGDSATWSLSMKSGTDVQGFFSFRTARADHVEVIGERGTLRIDRHEPNFTVRVVRKMGYGTRRQLVLPDAAVGLWRAQRVVRRSIDPSYKRTLASFIDSIRGGQSRLASMSDGARSLEVILAAEASARAQMPVRIRA